MSALELLKSYFTGDSSSDEDDFSGFDLVDRTGERFVQKSVCLQLPDYLPPLDAPDTQESPFSSTEEENPVDSDGSFFETSATRNKNRKRTAKEIKKRIVAKKRRKAHRVKLTECNCRKECWKKVSKDERISTHYRFWKQDEAGQCAYIRERVERSPVKNRIRNRYVNDNPVKLYNYEFSIQTENGESVTVCRKFFLNTLGYSEDCGNIVYRNVTDDEEGTAKVSQRGKYKRSSTKRDAVVAHIQSYNPTISHYRREHAPNRLYLPSDLTEKSMHQNFLDTHDFFVSYSVYSRQIKLMNISFVKLGNEQCETCVAAGQHTKDSGHNFEDPSTKESCQICSKFFDHKRFARQSRAAYQYDGDEVQAGHVVLSVDLQKVIQLPRLEGLKTIVFSQRLLAFNETFAPVGKYARDYPVIACLWEESISGRSANDIASCFQRTIQRFGESNKITLWLDNCSGQNKNWNLFLHLILLLNSDSVQVKELVLKYFESGHTFMSADSFHAAVEKGMRKSTDGPVVTFPDFKIVVEKAKKNVEVLEMTHGDFFQTTITASQYTLNKLTQRPYIENIRKVVLKKGSYQFGYSNSVEEESSLEHCLLFSKKQLKTVSESNFSFEDTLKRLRAPRGIDSTRKGALLNTILPVIDESKKQFWQDLPQQIEKP